MPTPDIRPFLQQTFGSRVEIFESRIVNQHADYWVIIAELLQPTLSVVVKIAGENAPLASDFERTTMLHQLVRAQTNIPTAEILGAGVFERWKYLIKAHIPGEEWRNVYAQLDAEQKRDAYEQIGAAVAQIHAIKFPAFGEIGAAGTPDFLTALKERAKLSIKNPRLQDMMLSVIDQHGRLFREINEARLCHEDLHHRNVLFKNVGSRWQLATILDFEKAWAGHAEIDLARLEFWDGMVSDGFWEGYGGVRDVLYEQRRPVYQLLWCLEYAAPTERHLADTGRLCEQLGIPAITDLGG